MILVRALSLILIARLPVKGMSELEEVHMVANSPADAIQQWFNAGGQISYYDYPLEVFLNVR